MFWIKMVTRQTNEVCIIRCKYCRQFMFTATCKRIWLPPINLTIWRHNDVNSFNVLIKFSTNSYTTRTWMLEMMSTLLSYFEKIAHMSMV